ncbi:probable cytochrome P450 6a14 [Armigeres subalbatus]|uniref:probable cytochrome P450 6a14 n=1 Tax=Armigeres subalbatus TaxID=124917 RepID=UPI002ED1347E
MELLTLVLTGFVCLSGIVYYFLRREQQQWSRLGVPIAKNPHLLYGNIRGIFQKEHSCEVLQRLYREFKGRGLKLGGIMNFFQPAVLVVDPEISKSILVKDFNKFHDRGIFVDSAGDPLSATLFSLEGAEWKTMRTKMSPTFTSGKMKYMFGSVVKVADQLKEYVAENCTKGNIELKNILQRYTMDVIGNVAFGVECNSIKNPSSEFRLMGLKANEFDGIKFFKFFIGGTYKSFAKKIKMKVVEKDVHNFFMSLVHSTIQYREANGVQRNDFMDLLIKIKNNGKLSDEPNSGGEGITISEIAAQCFIFFTAGFETSSTTINFCLYELGRNPNIQDRLRREIEESIAKDGGELKYDTLFGMSYLDRVVSETLRKYSPVDNLFRVSNSPYTPEGCDFTIPAGTMFQIPIHSTHHDPDYFPNPQCFDPDRFLPEAVKSRHPFAYLPFGEGPRICIGMRFGQMQTKIGLVTLLRNFRFAPISETPDRLDFDAKTFVLTPKTGVYLKIEPIARMPKV